MGHYLHAILVEVPKKSGFFRRKAAALSKAEMEKLWLDTSLALNENFEDTGMTFGEDPPNDTIYGSDKRYYISGASEPALFLKALADWTQVPVAAAMEAAHELMYRDVKSRSLEEIERTPGLQRIPEYHLPGLGITAEPPFLSGFPRATPLISEMEVLRMWADAKRVRRVEWSAGEGGEDDDDDEGDDDDYEDDEDGDDEEEVSLTRPPGLDAPGNEDLADEWESQMESIYEATSGEYSMDSGFFSIPMRSSKLVSDDIDAISKSLGRYAIMFYDIHF